MADAHPLEGVLERMTLIGAIIAVAALWSTLWSPWKDLSASMGLDVSWEVFIFLGPLVIVLVLVMWWINTH